MTLPEKEAGEDFKTNDAVCYAVFRASTAKVRIIIKTNLKRTRDNQYGKKEMIEGLKEDIEEYDDVGTFEEDTKDPLEDDSNFSVDLNNISLNGGSKLDRKIKF